MKSEYANFTISILMEKKSVLNKKKKAGDEEAFQTIFNRQDSIRLKKGSMSTITFTFIPLSMENTKCYVIFQDINVGEF